MEELDFYENDFTYLLHEDLYIYQLPGNMYNYISIAVNHLLNVANAEILKNFLYFPECGQASFIRKYKEGRNQVPDPPTPGTGSPLHQHHQLVLARTHSETWLY